MHCSIFIDSGAGYTVLGSGTDYPDVNAVQHAAIAAGRDAVMEQMRRGRPVFPNLSVVVSGEAGELVLLVPLRRLLFGDAIADRHRALYETLPFPCLRLNRDLSVVEANAPYLRETFTDRETIAGLNMFEAFPDNPNDRGATGAANLSASLDHVLRARTPHRMARQRYDIRTRSRYWLRRYWLPINVPLLDHNGEVAEIIHHVEKSDATVRPGTA